ncbi:hypothetical protein ACX0G7_07155 [Flavitalea antarctica]
MPVKTSTTSLIALGLASFAAGLLVSRRRCWPCSSHSNVRKWGRLYLSVNNYPEEFDKDSAIDAELKKITAQIQANHVDKYGYQGKYRLGYTWQRIAVEGKRLLEVQYYTVRITDVKDNYNNSTFKADSSYQGSDTPRAGAQMMSLEAGSDTGHTPPQCPRPRPGYTSKYDFEGWECSYY